MVSSDVNDARSLGGHLEEMLEHLEVIGGEIALSKLPNVYNVTIENQGFGLNGLEVLHQFPGVTPVGAQVDV
jgi:hypothetical protein